MLEGRVDLVGELFAVDAGSSSSRACGVARLDHEVRDDAVEDDVVVVTSLSEGREILTRLGRMLIVELDGDGTLEVWN